MQIRFYLLAIKATLFSDIIQNKTDISYNARLGCCTSKKYVYLVTSIIAGTPTKIQQLEE